MNFDIFDVLLATGLILAMIGLIIVLIILGWLVGGGLFHWWAIC